jgi:hypothetical protein
VVLSPEPGPMGQACGVLVVWAHLLLLADAGVAWRLAHGADPVLASAVAPLSAGLAVVCALLLRGWRRPPVRTRSAPKAPRM